MKIRILFAAFGLVSTLLCAPSAAYAQFGNGGQGNYGQGGQGNYGNYGNYGQGGQGNFGNYMQGMNLDPSGGGGGNLNLLAGLLTAARGNMTANMFDDKGNPTQMLQQQIDTNFHRRDRNNDNLLRGDEIPEDLAMNLWDKNKDKAIDYKEFSAYFVDRVKQRTQAFMGNNNPQANAKSSAAAQQKKAELESRTPVIRAEKLPDNLPDWFRQLDINADGQVSLYEWNLSAKAVGEFFMYDLDQDGFITAEEILRYTARQPPSPPQPSLAANSARSNMPGNGNQGPQMGNGSGFNPAAMATGGGQGNWQEMMTQAAPQLQEMFNQFKNGGANGAASNPEAAAAMRAQFQDLIGQFRGAGGGGNGGGNRGGANNDPNANPNPPPIPSSAVPPNPNSQE